MANDERTKLRTVLGYWIEHNKEHSQEFREWAARAAAFGEVEAGEDMLAAAKELDRANELLSRALSRLGERGS